MENQLELLVQMREQKVVQGLFLLTTKPVLYVYNVDEDVVSDQILSIMWNKFVNLQRQKKYRGSCYFRAC